MQMHKYTKTDKHRNKHRKPPVNTLQQLANAHTHTTDKIELLDIRI